LPVGRSDEDRLVADMIELTRQFGRYGYRRIAALLRDAGWQVNDKRVESLWRSEGLKVPMKQPKKGRLWLNDGSCVRLCPEYRDHVWSYDFGEKPILTFRAVSKSRLVFAVQFGPWPVRPDPSRRPFHGDIVKRICVLLQCSGNRSSDTDR